MSKKLFILLSVSLLFLSCSSKERKRPEPQSFEELSGLRVCLMEGSIEQDYSYQYLMDKDIEFSCYPGISDCLLAVKQNKADVYFGADYQAFNQAFKENNMKICHRVTEIDAPFAFCLDKKQDKLLEDLNVFIDSLKLSGELQEMDKRWFNESNTDFHDCIKIPPVPADSELSGEPVLRVGISGVKQPAEVLINNKWTGFEIELLQRFAQEKGMQIDLSVYDFKNLMPALQTGKIDIASATICITEERLRKVNFTHAIRNMITCFIVNGEEDATVSVWSRIKHSAYVSLVLENRWEIILKGLETTILITLVALLLGILLGSALCAMKLSGSRTLQAIYDLYVYLMRNIPILVFLMMMFYVFLAHSGLEVETIAIIAFGMNSAAFLAEIFRTGLLSVDDGQREAARGLGCNKIQGFRYVVAPQAAKAVVPVFKNQCVTLLKETSVVGYISIVDLTKASDLIRCSSFEAFFPLIIITILYFVLATLLMVTVNFLTKKL